MVLMIISGIATVCAIGATIALFRKNIWWGAAICASLALALGGVTAYAATNASIDAKVAAKAAAATPTTEESADFSIETDGEVGTESADGKVVTMPNMGNGDEILSSADSTSYAPASFKGVQGRCGHGKILSWTQLIDCVDGSESYIDAVNSRSNLTGFDWEDVNSFSALEEEFANTQGVSVDKIRTAQIVSFGSYEEETARAQARDLLGDAGEGIAFVHKSPGFANTWALKGDKISEYYYSSQQVRVSLFPIEKVDGEILVNTSRSEGVFVDCLNIWWQPTAAWKCTDEQCTKPAEKENIITPTPVPGKPVNPGSSGTPVNPETPVNPPATPELKNRTLEPASRGNAPSGGGRNADSSGSGVYVPPAEMAQPSAKPYTAPATPKPAPAKSPSNGQTLKPDTATPPPPEAEVPTEVPTTCIPAPGYTSC